MTERSPSLRAFVLPFATFALFLGFADLFRSLFKHRDSVLFAAPEHWIYPVQTIVCGFLLWRFWSCYGLRKPEKIGLDLFVAILVLALWISPQAFLGFPRRDDGFNPSLFENNPALFCAVVAMRFVRLVVVVPLAEEIFWRGFLLRYIVHDDFKKVPLGQFSWLSFGVVTVAFAAAHRPADWPAALATSALYNLILYRTRSLSSCVLAHAITNLGLGVYVMLTRQWGFW